MILRRRLTVTLSQFACTSFLLAVMPLSTALARPLSFDSSAGFIYDSNINRTQRTSQREGDGIFQLAGKAAYRRQLGANHGFIANVGLGTDLHTDFGDLSVLRLGVSVSYLVQPVAGFSRPWLAFTGRFEVEEYAASDIRDGNRSSLGLELGQRLSDRIAVRLGYTVSDRNASKSAVFETHQGQLHAIAEYSAWPRWKLYTKYDYTHGGMVTGAPRAAKLLAVSRARTRDRVFGLNNVAWRLEAESHAGRFGAKYTLAKHSVLDTSISHIATGADGDNQWRVWQFGIHLFHRFN